jgi:hypothetical protein
LQSNAAARLRQNAAARALDAKKKASRRAR